MSSAASSRALIDSWWQFPVAVLLAVIAFVAVGARPAALPFVYLAAVTPALCSIDVLERRLPNRIVLPGYLVAVAGMVAQWLVSGEVPAVVLISGAVYFSFMLAFGVAGGMGMGDVKLAGVLGLSAGLLGATTAVISPVAAFLLGGVAAVAALRGSGGGRQGGGVRGASIPFGPFLLAGFWIAVVLS